MCYKIISKRSLSDRRGMIPENKTKQHKKPETLRMKEDQ